MEDSKEDSRDVVMNPLGPQNYLFGCELQADKDYHFKVDNDENEHQLCLQTVSLGADAKDELHMVEAEAMNYEGNSIKITLATLKMSTQPTVFLGGFEVIPPVILRLKCGSGPVYISGQHLVAVEEDTESEEEEDVKLVSVSEKRSAPGNDSKVPQKKVRFAVKKDGEDGNEDSNTNEAMASTMSQKKKEPPKRKITDEGRLFNEKWTDDYFFVEANSKALCLICREFVQVFEDYNLKTHYMQKHAAKFSAYEGLRRKDKIVELKKCLYSQQTFFQKVTARMDSIVKASFVVAHLIAKKSKPITDGEFIKQCIESVAGVMCPEKRRDISKISLSPQTIARRIEEIGKSVERILQRKAINFKFYALAMVDNSDATDTAHLAIFIRGIDDKYNVTEELAALVPLKHTTTSRDLYEAVKHMLKQFSLSVFNISGIVTDGVPAMIGKREGLVKLIEDDAIAAQNSHLMKYHCIVHQENLCTKALKMDNVIKIIIKTVDFVRAKGLNHHQFQEFLKSIDADYGDIYVSGVRWLSRSQMLKRFYDLRHVIKSFMISKNKFVPELDDENWLTDLAFLVDLTGHLNELNVRLQGENQLINTMFQTIIAFQMKLKLWQAQIKANNFMHFNMLAKHSPVNIEKYAALIFDLIQEFENRFQIFHENNQYFAIFATPFSVDINMLPASFQMECVELQSDIQLKEKFDRVSLLDFYRSYLPRDKYPLLHNHALFMSSLFGSTYICKQLFSRMKHIKSKVRARIPDKHLENSLRIATTSIRLDIDAPVSQMQSQTSY